MPSRAQQKESRRQERIASEQARQELARRRPESTPTTEIDIERFSEEARAFWSLVHTMGFREGLEHQDMERLCRQSETLLTVAKMLLEPALPTVREIEIARRVLGHTPMVVSQVTAALDALSRPGGGAPDTKLAYQLVNSGITAAHAKARELKERG